MSGEPIDFILDRFLKSQHDKKRNNTRGKTDADAGNSNSVDRCGESSRLLSGYSPRYEVGQVQCLLLTYSAKMLR